MYICILYKNTPYMYLKDFARTEDLEEKIKFSVITMVLFFAFSYECGWALAEASQRGCGTSILGNNQKPPGQHPGHPTIDGPAWEEGLDKINSIGPF